MSCKECEEKAKVHPDFRKYKRLDMVSNFLFSTSKAPWNDPDNITINDSTVLAVLKIADKIIDLNEQYEKDKEND